MLTKKIENKDEFFNIPCPGVTTILANVFGKDEFKDIPKPVLDAAIERGKAVHSYIEHHIYNSEWEEIELAYQIYIDYFKEWEKEYEPIYLGSELMLENIEDGYKGIVDTIFQYTDKNTGEIKVCLCDWKTSSNLNRFKTMCQLNLYARMFEKHYDLKIDEIRTLSITKTGWRFSKFELSDNISQSILYLNGLKKMYNNE